MKTAFAASLLSLLALSSAAPTTPPARTSSNSSIIYPFATSLYAVWTGAITYGSTYGLIQKTQTSSDISTLVTFSFPASTQGKNCAFNFILSNTATVTGTGQADVFTTLANPTGSTSSWPPGNQRDLDLGRIQAVIGGPATSVMDFTGQNPIPCPAGQTITLELVPTGDLDMIKWDVLSEGPEVDVY
jgi:Ubiquitin 3 binding protein But2 C-terminal domain